MALETVWLQALISGILLGLVYALVAEGLTLIWGLMKLINFAQGEFTMVAMYSTYWLQQSWGVDPLFSLILNVGLFSIIGVLTYQIVVRRLLAVGRVEIQIFATVGISTLLTYLAVALWTPTPRSLARSSVSALLSVSGIVLSYAEITTAVVTGATYLALALFVKFTKVGKALRATMQDTEAAMSVGVDVDKMYLLGWTIGLACAGVAGTLMAVLFVVSPFIGIRFMFGGFAAVTLGGVGSIPGALVGGIIVGAVSTTLGSLLDPSFTLVYLFFIFVAALLIKPKGLLSRG